MHVADVTLGVYKQNLNAGLLNNNKIIDNNDPLIMAII